MNTSVLMLLQPKRASSGVVEPLEARIAPAFAHPFDLASLNGTTGFTINGVAAADYAGRIASAGDVNGDGFGDLIVGAPGADESASGSGAAYVVFGQASGFTSPIELSALNGTTGFKMRGSGVDSRTGIAVAGAGDVNADGFSDVIVGAILDDEGANNAGAAFVVFGKATFTSSLELSALDGTNGFKLIGGAGNDGAGTAVASAGDVNGDGFGDVIVGANGADVNGSGAGAAYVVYGARSFFLGKISLKNLDPLFGFTIRGSAAGDSLGQAVSAAGDLNGDGFDEVLVGAPSTKSNGNNLAGASYVIYGRANGFATTYKSSALNGSDGFAINGAAAFDIAGSAVAGCGDVNGDGFDDLLIGAVGVGTFPPTRPGLVHVVFGNGYGFGAALNLSTLDGTNGFTISGEDPGDSAARVRFAGDVNGDGFDDVIVGAIYNAPGGVRSGAAYVVFGKANGFDPTLLLASLNGANGFKLEGVNAYDIAGVGVGGAVDVNGDGFDDILVGAGQADPGGKSNAGQSYVIFGTDTGAVTHPGDAGANTLTGDGAANVLIGGRANDTLIGGGGVDALRGGEGDDVLAVSDLTFRRADGGLGTDTLRLDGAGFFLDLTASNSARLRSLEGIDLTGSGANFLSLDANSLLALSPNSNALTVVGGADDFVNFDLGWIDAGTEVIGVDTFIVFSKGLAVLRVSAAVGTSRASGFALDRPEPGEGFTVIGQSANDQMGRAAAMLGDVNGDGFDDVLLGAYRADTAGVFTGAAYVVFGKAGVFDPTLDLAALDGTNGFRIRGLAPGAVGLAFSRGVGAAGDVNGDGFADFIVGADGTASSTGAAYVIFGRGTFSSEIDVATLTGATGFKLSGDVKQDFAGSSVGTAGDVNGDGFSDLFIAASSNSAGAKNAGAAYIVFGKATPFADDVPLASLTGANGFRITGAAAQDFLGGSFASRNPAAGDVNGDGFGDIIVGASNADANGKDSGAAYVIFGKANGFAKSLSVKDLDGTNGFQLRAVGAGDYAGFSASGVGDVNGDGVADMIVGARGADPNGNYSGASYVIFGKTTPFTAKVELATLDVATGFKINGTARNAFSGYSAVGAGDVNGDGFDDLLVSDGARFGSIGTRAETAYVVFGHAGGFGATFELSQIDGANGIVLSQFNGTGETRVVSGGGDVNGDGFDDIVVGAWFASVAGRSYSGQAHVFFGRNTGSVTHPGDGNANTLTGDGGANVFVGGQANDTLLGNGGSDSFRGGQGDDLFAVSDLNFLRVAGGTGTDTLRLDGSGFALNLRAIAGTRAHGFEQIDITGSGANTLTLTKLDVVNLAPQSNTLTVLGDAGDVVNFGPGWIKEANQTIGPTTFHVFTQGAATLRIAQDVSVPDLPAGYTLPVFDGTLGFAINGAGANDQAASVSRAGDVNGDGFDDFLIGARFAAPNGANSGATYVVFGQAGAFTSPVDLGALNGTDGFVLRGEAPNGFTGFSPSAVGDFNGDGFADIAVESIATTGANQSGTVYVVFGHSGSFDPALELGSLDGTKGFKLRATATSVLQGVVVNSAGDVNGDGFDDIVVGAPNTNSGALTQTGRAHVVFGRATSPGAPIDLATLNGTTGFTIAGTKKAELLGQWVGGGDVNGDGFSDVIVGTLRSNDPDVVVVYGHAGSFLPSILDSTLNGVAGFTLTGGVGESVSAAGDVNGDGIGDLLVGAPFSAAGGTTSGTAYVVFGKVGATFGKTVNLAALNGANGFQIIGREPLAYAGQSVSAAGDVNGDGFDDVILGAAFTDQRGVQTGEAYVIYGKASFAPSFNIGALDGTNGFSLIGTDFGTRAGRSVSGAGDVNGDGFDDVLVGSYGVLSGSNAAGRSYLIYGFDTGAVTQLGGPGSEPFTGTAGRDVIVAGRGNDTVTNGGTNDVLRGGQGDDNFSLVSGPLGRLVGGHGFDTLTLNGGLLLDLTARPVYRINGFEQVDLRPGVNGIALDARAVVNLSPDTNTLIVRADASDIVNIGTIGPGGWTITGTEVFDGETLTVLTQGAATLKVSPFFAPVVTIVNPTTATYTDVDGDLVTIKVSKGTLGVSDFFLFKSGIPEGAQLAAVNFADDGAEFQASELTITAARTTLGGDGHVNVGRIDALGVDLGKVTIGGDLRAISVGDANLATTGLAALNIGSMGLYGITTQGASGLGFSIVQGTLGALDIATDLLNAPITAVAPTGGLGFGSVKIGGSIQGGVAGFTGLFTGGSTGAVTIGQDIRGGSGPGAGSMIIGGDIASLTVGGSLVGGTAAQSGAVFTQGTLGAVKIGGDLDHATIAARTGIKSLAVTGSVLNAKVFAGYDSLLAPVNADATIGAVTVAGDWVASSLVVGVQSSDPFFGNGGETLISSGSPAVSGGDPAKIAKITSIAIKGEAIGTPGGADHFGFVAEEIGSFSVGGTAFPLTKGAGNDLNGLRVGSTLDVKVREVKKLGPFEQPPAVEDPAGGPAFSLGSIDGDNGFRFDGLAVGEQAGRTVSSAGDVNGDGFDDIIIGAAGVKVAGQDSIGEAYVIFGTDKGLPASLDAKDLNGKNGFRIQADLGNSNSYFALAVGGAGDVNNDGFDDVIVGGLQIGSGFVGSTEKAVVIFGKASGFAPIVKAATLNGSNGFELTHPFAADPNFSTYVRMSVGGVGDLNGDGFGDVAIGAVNADFGTQNSGSVYVYFGGATPPASFNVNTLNGTNGFRLDGPNAFANLGYSLSAAGDVNGDGFADLIAGAPRALVGGQASGSGYVVFGKNTPFAASFGVGALLGATGFRIPAIDNRGDTGNTVSGGGDVNGDGFDDIVIGAPYAYDGPSAYPGKSYVIFGKKTSIVGNFPAEFPLGTLDGTNGFKITGESDYDYAGRAVIAGDVNGDPFDDIVVGAIGIEAHNEFRGGAYVIYGKLTPPADVLLSSLDGLNGVKILGARAGDQAGLGINGAGDFNNDGKADLLVGAYSAAFTTTNAGAAFLVSGASLVYGVDISTDGKTATFTDVDGDHVTIKTSKGGFVPGDFVFKPAGQTGGIQLQTIDLSGTAHDPFAGANITITAARGPTGGDGFVNVGAVLAGNHDLGAVTIDGDLGQLDAGNGDPLKPAVTALTVQSLGQLGLSTQVPAGASLESNLKGKLGAFTVKSDIVGAFVNVAGSANDGDDDSGAVTIGGSLRGGALANSGSIFAAGDLGAVKIGRSVLGGAGPHSGSVEAGAKFASISIAGSLLGGVGAASGSLIAGTTLGATTIGGDLNGGRVFAKGNLLPTSTAFALAIKSVNIGGSVSRADIFAGYDRNGAPANADVQIGAVNVGRDWIASDLVAGLRPIDANFGNDDDELIPGGNAITSKIASIVIKGQVLGTPNAVSNADHFGFVAEEIGAFTIGGTAFKLMPGVLNDLAGLPVGATDDLRVREI